MYCLLRLTSPSILTAQHPPQVVLTPGCLGVVTDYVPGGNMHEYVRQRQFLREEDARYISACNCVAQYCQFQVKWNNWRHEPHILLQVVFCATACRAGLHPWQGNHLLFLLLGFDTTCLFMQSGFVNGIVNLLQAQGLVCMLECI